MSLSLRERGLKSFKICIKHLLCCVALLARAWIEIQMPELIKSMKDVALLARAWIEMSAITDIVFDSRVALLARAWIEIMSLSILAISCGVALLARAWIEIYWPLQYPHRPKCRSPCESVD